MSQPVTKQCAVTSSHYTPTTLGHNSALLQMHQLQRELEILKTCRAQEAMPATTGEDHLPLQGQEPLVRTIPILEGGLQRVECLLCTVRALSCGKGAQLPSGFETYRAVCVVAPVWSVDMPVDHQKPVVCLAGTGCNLVMWGWHSFLTDLQLTLCLCPIASVL